MEVRSMCRVLVLWAILVGCTGLAIPEKGVLGASADVPHLQSLLEMPPPVDLDVTLHFRSARKYMESGVTLVVQSDVGRLARAKVLAERWRGPVSFALLLRKDEGQAKVEDFWNGAPDMVKDFLTIHLCKAKDGFERYPINKMRNNAMREVRTEFVYIMDIDETPVGDMYTHLDEVHRAQSLSSGKTAFVVMSWQWKGSNTVQPPTNRDELVKMHREGLVGIKSPYNHGGYLPADVSLDEWVGMDSAKKTHFRDMFEPYYIIQTSQEMPFDERFVGYGGNYYVHTLDMAAEKFEWVVLPHVFNFNDEDPSHHEPREVDNGFIDQATREIGSRHGCADCSHYSCIKNCPGFGGNPSALVAAATSVTAKPVSSLVDENGRQPPAKPAAVPVIANAMPPPAPVAMEMSASGGGPPLAMAVTAASTSGSAGAQLQDQMLVGMPHPVNIEVHTSYRTGFGNIEYDSITLALQGDMSRLARLEEHTKRWNGPISFAVLVKDGEDQTKVDDFWKTAPDTLKKHVSLHLCVAKEQFDLYPINKMRNIAMRNVPTEWVYLMDIDEVTMGSMAEHRDEVRKAESGMKRERPAYVIMAWQWVSAERRDVPTKRDALKALFKDGLVGIKAQHVPASYTPPDVSYDEWLKMDTAKPTKFGDGFEPYYIVRTSQVIDFDPRFVGWGYNKRIQTLEMAAQKFHWTVLPNVFNFADEDPTSKTHAKPADYAFVESAFAELGKKYGCDRCSWRPTADAGCVKNCPDVFNMG